MNYARPIRPAGMNRPRASRAGAVPRVSGGGCQGARSPLNLGSMTAQLSMIQSTLATALATATPSAVANGTKKVPQPLEIAGLV